MSNLFLILLLVSIISFFIGLIKPSIFSFILGQNASRKKTGLVFALATVVFFILVGITIDPIDKSSSKDSELSEGTASLVENIEQAEDVETEQKEPSEETKASLIKVVRVIDGDTIEIEGGQKIRYIGIDTPETVHPSKPIECFGKEASNKNKELVEGKMVRLEKDVSETDKYGRLLRYIWINDLMVNDYLVRNGYAMSSSYPPDIKYQDQFIEAQKEARENNRGLWSVCQEEEPEPIVMPTPVTEPTPTVKPTPTPQPQPDYICSYNAYNCSNFATHAQAQAAYEYCGGISNDIHDLDRDNDGSACESLP